MYETGGHRSISKAHGAWAVRTLMCWEARPQGYRWTTAVAMRQDRQLIVSLPGQVLYKLAWSESMERDCATFCAKK